MHLQTFRYKMVFSVTNLFRLQIGLLLVFLLKVSPKCGFFHVSSCGLIGYIIKEHCMTRGSILVVSGVAFSEGIREYLVTMGTAECPIIMTRGLIQGVIIAFSN